MINKLARQIGNEIPGIASSTARKTAIGRVAKRPLSSHKTRGSLAGLHIQKKAMLEIAGTGYGAPSNQLARYNRKRLPMGGKIGSISHSNTFESHTNMGIMPAKNSSAARIVR